MQVSIIRQTPAASILLTLLIVVATFVRFALAPYGDELISSGVATLGAKVDAFQSTYPVWGWIFSAVIVLLNSFSVGRTASALVLCQPRTTRSIPPSAFVACGIFLATDSLAVSLASLFSVQMMRYLCGGYVRGTYLNYAFYAGLCAGVAALFYAPMLTFIALLPVAIMMFGFSWREVVVMVVGAIFPLTATCYLNWLWGGEFLAPATTLLDALATNSGYSPWGSDSVVALAEIGLILFAVICGIVALFGDKRSVAMRPRTIIMFNLLVLVVALATFALPSATVGVFMMVALPAAILIPVGLIHARDIFSNLLITTLLLLTILHLFVA